MFKGSLASEMSKKKKKNGEDWVEGGMFGGLTSVSK